MSEVAPFDPDAYARAWPGRNNRPAEVEYEDTDEAEAEYLEYAREEIELAEEIEIEETHENAQRFFAPSVAIGSSEDAEREALAAMAGYLFVSQEEMGQILTVGVIFSNLAVARAIREQTEKSSAPPVVHRLNRETGVMERIEPNG